MDEGSAAERSCVRALHTVPLAEATVQALSVPTCSPNNTVNLFSAVSGIHLLETDTMSYDTGKQNRASLKVSSSMLTCSCKNVSHSNIMATSAFFSEIFV